MLCKLRYLSYKGDHVESVGNESVDGLVDNNLILMLSADKFLKVL